jgi:putative membrane-bound dehydrogenase-like protein
VVLLWAPISTAQTNTNDRGVLPTNGEGQPLNFDFETGTLKDWTATGQAFEGQPIEGDTVTARRSDMKSQHAGKYWVGSFERNGDGPRGTLTSVPFTVTKPFASFLIAGGTAPSTSVEIIREDTKQAITRVSGDETEELKRVLIDLSSHLGKPIMVRLVDNNSNGWGHLNFDDFRFHDQKPSFPTRLSLTLDIYQHSGLPPVEAAAAMTVPDGFKVTLFAGEPDVHQPIAFTIDDRGRLWVAEAFSYPIRRPAAEAKDRIVIFEDKDGDGKFDSHKVFAEGLNLVSGIEVGFGGIWVGTAPEFVFIPDKDGDDKADGPPVVLLDGWGYQDTHEMLNTFTWGPDGWLYGCHGVFTHSRIGKPGTPDVKRIPMNAAIWRYHPTKHIFEVFAAGTSNPWGFDFNERGQAFLTSCVIPHLYHVIPGARYERQAGAHFNPFTYDDIKTIADHRHYLGANPHGGNGRSDAAGGGHAHSGAMIYLGDTWPQKYRDTIFMNNIHGARINRDILTPKGSGYVGSHSPDFLRANDSWSQVLNLKYGPDGNVFMIDWYDGQQCHLTDPKRHDRSNGRIFKVTYGPSKTVNVNLRSMTDEQLVGLMSHKNAWYSRTARRVLQERGLKTAAHEGLAKLAFQGENEIVRLNSLWALHSTQGLTSELVLAHLNEGSPQEIGWKVRLGLEEKKPSTEFLKALTQLARTTKSPVVRLEIASALQRISEESRWPIIEALLSHGEDATDINLPYLIWYGFEPLAVVDTSHFLRVALEGQIGMVRDFAIRRVGAIGTPEAITLLVDAVGSISESKNRIALLNGLNLSLKGRRQVTMPPNWPKVFAKVTHGADRETTSLATALALTFGDDSARSRFRDLILDHSAEIALRRDALTALLKVRDPELSSALRKLVAQPALRAQAIRGLAGYDDPQTPATLIGLYPSLSSEERRDLMNTLAARPGYAKELLAAVGSKKIAATELSADVVRQLRNLNDPTVNDQISKYWGSARQTTAERAKRIADTKVMLTRATKVDPDASSGRVVFVKACAQCHSLFGVGGKVGPDLTGSNRRDLDYVLSNVLDPSALIGKDYLANVIATTDGRVLTGIIKGEDKDAITLVTANETLTIPKGEVEARRPSDASMMPEDLLKPFSETEVRALVTYLASPAQVALEATAENAKAFFNGRDLTGWEGDPSLWSVEKGELVGKTAGLKRNEFLKSTIAASNFRLSVEVKLVKNEGNSGIQFRSIALPDGEMKGDQADIGPGWWGKLYEENGRALLWDKSGEKHVKLGEWNRYEVIANGSKIQTLINGNLCVDLDDPKGARSGIFAFQLHSGGATEVRYRKIQLELLGGSK